MAARHVQREIWTGLDIASSAAFALLREMSRTTGHVAASIMPVVFTSTLIHAARRQRATVREPHRLQRFPDSAGFSSIIKLTSTMAHSRIIGTILRSCSRRASCRPCSMCTRRCCCVYRRRQLLE